MYDVYVCTVYKHAIGDIITVRDTDATGSIDQPDRTGGINICRIIHASDALSFLIHEPQMYLWTRYNNTFYFINIYYCICCGSITFSSFGDK